MNYMAKLILKKAENKQNVLTKQSSSQTRQAQWIMKSYEESDLGELKWVGEETMKILFENWIYSQKDIIDDKERIEKIKLPFFSKRGITNFLKTI